MVSGIIYSNDNKVSLSKAALQKHLDKQYNFLIKSCVAYDDGDEDEILRVATTLRVLLHDTKRSKSLLGQLKLKDKFYYIDSGVYRETLDAVKSLYYKNKESGLIVAATSPGEAGLVVSGFTGDKFEWVAPLTEKRFPIGHPYYEANEKPKNFDAWWRTPLIEKSDKKYFTRENLVLIMANQDGGAHVDSGIDNDYEQLCREYYERYYSFDPNAMNADFKEYAGNIAAASVRQIAFEFMLTVDRHSHVGLLERIKQKRSKIQFQMPEITLLGTPAD